MNIEQRIAWEYIEQQSEQSQALLDFGGYSRIDWLMLLTRIGNNETQTGIYDTDERIIRFYAQKYNLPTDEMIHDQLESLDKRRSEIYANWGAWYNRRAQFPATSEQFRKATEQLKQWSSSVLDVEKKIKHVCDEYPAQAQRYYAAK